MLKFLTNCTILIISVIATGWADGVRSTAFAETARFNNPRIDGYWVDRCHTYGSGCNKQAADAFCRYKGYQAEVDHGWSYKAPTRTLGDRRVCNASSCGGFDFVVCHRRDEGTTRGSNQRNSQWVTHRFWGANAGGGRKMRYVLNAANQPWATRGQAEQRWLTDARKKLEWAARTRFGNDYRRLQVTSTPTTNCKTTRTIFPVPYEVTACKARGPACGSVETRD
jgi:hypothetical protein